MSILQLIISVFLGYFLTIIIEFICKKIYKKYKNKKNFQFAYISDKRIKAILLQENHGVDIDTVVSKLNENEPLQFKLK